jgi:Dioxygenase
MSPIGNRESEVLVSIVLKSLSYKLQNLVIALLFSLSNITQPSLAFSCTKIMFPSFLFLFSTLIWAVALAQEESSSSSLPVLVFNGRVVNDLGEPLEGALVQFWQTDENGNYDHPNFNLGGETLLPFFQYFGTANTSEDGSFVFKTHRPGLYPQRPISHIHYKVWWKGSNVLTSQFYFIDENTSQPPSLQLTLQEQEDGSLFTNKTIALDLGLGGTEAITPSQTEGPFYPVVDFFGLDSDMTVVTADEQAAGTTIDGGDTVEEGADPVTAAPTSSVPVSQTPSVATTPNMDSAPTAPTSTTVGSVPSATVADDSRRCTVWVSLFLGASSIMMLFANQ